MKKIIVLIILVAAPALADNAKDAACLQVLKEAQAVHAGDPALVTPRLVAVGRRYRAMGCDPNTKPFKER